MNKFSAILFFTILCIGFASYFVISADAISSEEKRKLSTFPKMQWQNYIQGHLTDSIDNYIDDHFPLRKRFIDMADEINYYKGLHANSGEKIVQPIVPIVQTEPDNDKPEDIDDAGDVDDVDDAGDTNDLLATDSPKEHKTTEKNIVYDNINGYFQNDMLILNGAAFPISGGIPGKTKPFAQMVNDYAEKLAGQVRVITAVAPLSSAFIPKRKYRYLNAQNQRTLETLHRYLSPDVCFSDVFAHLNAHSTEYIFFKTDHHWTALGAYYAYEAFCEATGITPVPKENMEKRTKPRFLGSLYSLTHDRNVKRNPDSVVYYVPHIATTASYFERETNQEVRNSVFCHKCKGYDTFLHMDYPLMRIKTNAKNGKKIVVIKDSMGNAFVVYLINHYEELWVVDFRYSEHNLMNLIQKNNINDMVFVVGMYNAQSRSVAKKMKRLGTQNFVNQEVNDTIISAAPIVSDTVPAITNDTLNNTTNTDTVNEQDTIK
ncbi:hypothetical protein AGMMS49982_01350 [Bacteroidia bacterium]|nr:hypothetical protein AGMMS49982_01350 [Bacteroidia bacterium]